MSRRRHVAVVLFATLLVVMHAPAVVGQTSDTLVVGGEHSSASELSTSSLTNAEVVRSGEAGTVSHGQHLSTARSRYAFDYGSGSTAYDYVGNADGSLNGATTWTADGVDFGGGNWTAPQSSADFGTDDFSFVITTTPEALNQLRIGSGDDGNGARFEVMFWEGTTETRLRDSESDGTDWFGNISYAAGERVTVAVVRDGDTFRLIGENGVDAEVTNSAIGSLTPDDVVSNDMFGGDADHVLHDVRTYDTALNASQVSHIAETDGKLSAASMDGDDAVYENGYEITGEVTVWTDLELENETATVTVEGYDGSSWTDLSSTTYSTSGNKTMEVDARGYEEVSTRVRFEQTDPRHTGRLDDEGILFTNHEPEADAASAAPSGGEVVDQVPPELSINVSDPEFGTPQGDELSIEWFVDNESRGTTTATSNGTETFELSSLESGEHTWHAEITDSYGETTTTQTFNFGAPGELRIYKETEPSELIDGENLSLRVRFFADGSEQVIEREVTDGTVDLAGLPADERYTVTVNANQTESWTYRRIIVDSLIETNSIYLLNQSEPNNRVVFQLDDPTGQFPPEETTLYVERALTKDYDGDGTDETRYQVIAGDTFGASGQFPIILQQDSRYRLRVETNDGDSSRILGAYSVYASTTEPLQIRRIAPSGNTESDSTFRAALEDTESGQQIAIRYRDFNESTDYVEYRVTNENGTVIVPNTTREANQFADIYPVTGDSFEVEYQVVRNGETTGGTIDLGTVDAIAERFGMDAQVLSIISWIMILSSMGLVVIINEQIAPIIGVGVASMLTILGTVAIPMTVLALAGAISVLTLVGGSQ